MVFDLLRTLYLVCVLVLALYALGSGVLLIAYLARGRRPITASQIAPVDSPPLSDSTLPTMCVQLPIYNEPRVVTRLIDAAACLEYPPGALSIQVLDDSTDETQALAAARVVYWHSQGVAITHLHRADRSGYKAGALAYGLRHTDAELIAVFDSDFVPPAGIVMSAAAELHADPTVGMVQTRWSHLNAAANPLTGALALDAHFVVEQSGRAQAGWLLNFNGSGGVWRRRAIEDAGGWRDTTLTEDLDLSYRAQFAGWRLAYRGDLSAPGEIPPTLSAYRQQQSRWALGGSQVCALLIGTLWRTPGLTLGARLMATLHLAQYLVHALILLVILLTPILIAANSLPDTDLSLLGFIGILPPLMMAVGQRALYPDWRARLLRGLPVLIVVATGMTWCNARAALLGLVRRGGEFQRTPKMGDGVGTSEIIAPANALPELAFCLYTAFGALLAWSRAPALVPYMALYAVCFGIATITLWFERRAARQFARSM